MSEIDWQNLSFGYVKTDFNIRCYYKDGQWGELEISSSEHLDLHMASICFHYGQEAFEGLKAFRGKDGKVRVFRIEENAKRMNSSADGVMMEPVPSAIFEEAVAKAVKLNDRFVPPYGSGASLYVRPLLIGISPGVSVSPAMEYLFMVFVSPVGPYFKDGFKPTKFKVERLSDRAAPQGTGDIKVGGNYAAGLKAGYLAKKEGYSAVIYLDSKEKKYIDEGGPANFFGIKGNTYITPQSASILPSITNMSLCQLAQEMGMKVERRAVLLEELAEFDEAGACGTAAVISPIGQVDDVEKEISYVFGNPQEPGEWSTKLYKKLMAIQNGDDQDKYNWVTVLE